MKKPDFIDAGSAVDLIKNGSTLCAIGMAMASACESIFREIENRFLEKGEPNNLTFVHSSSISDRSHGMQHLAHKGLLKRVIGGHWGLAPKIMEMISANSIEAFNIPQGQMANLYHSMALREPGKLSKVGLGTFIDPRNEGGKMNRITKECGDDLVSLVTVDGEEYIQYRHFPIDTLLIRGTSADEDGNISTEEEAALLEILPAVMATKRYGGKVICQVRQLVKNGSMNPKNVSIPGVFVDAVVECGNPKEEHRQTSSWFYDPAYSGQELAQGQAIEPIEMGIRKIIGRRAAMFLKKDAVINLGIGIPNDTVGAVLAEEGLEDAVTLTVESGIYGGTPAGGADFGIARYPRALITHDRQFEYYNGAGVDFAFMGSGELDSNGNVNSTKMGDRTPGSGGFIDITSRAKNVVFCSTFTGGGLEIDFSEAGLRIKTEGKIRKLVREVQQVSYNGKIALKNGQKAYYVTERCVFRLTENGPELIEIAKGIDLEKDILAQMEFKPLVSDPLKVTPLSLYSPGPFGLKSTIT